MVTVSVSLVIEPTKLAAIPISLLKSKAKKSDLSGRIDAKLPSAILVI